MYVYFFFLIMYLFDFSNLIEELNQIETGATKIKGKEINS